MGSVEERLGPFQVLFAEYAHPDPLRLWFAARALEHKAVVTCLGDAAEIKRVLIFVTDDEADEIDVEAPARRQILDGEHRMTGARDVERRVVDRLRNTHETLPAATSDGRPVLEHVCANGNERRRQPRSAL